MHELWFFYLKIQIQPGLVLEYEVGETATLLCLTDQEDTKVRWERLDDKNFTGK